MRRMVTVERFEQLLVPNVICKQVEILALKLGHQNVRVDRASILDEFPGEIVVQLAHSRNDTRIWTQDPRENRKLTSDSDPTGHGHISRCIAIQDPDQT